jgi:serine/threonine-protein kinase
MAPEQLEGEKADSRTDIFAFGAVLYEMVTGHRAFEGKSRASLIAAILSSSPRPISELQPMTPPLLDRVVKRCLAKDPDERWQSAGDLTAELRWITEGAAQVSEPASPAVAGWKRQRVVLTGIIACLLAGLLWSLSRMPTQEAPERPVVRAALPLAEGETIAFAEDFPLGAGRPSLALSPDGSKVAFVVKEGESTRIHLRQLADAESTPLRGTEGGYDPFFSPDGNWLAYFTADKLKKVSLSGGQPITLCEAANPYGGSWGDDDKIVFSGEESTRLMRVAGAGGNSEVLSDFPASVWAPWPQVLPGAHAVLFTVMESTGNPDYWSLAAFFPESGELRRLLHGGSFGRYVPTRHLIYVRGGALYAVPFDPDRVETTGASTLLLDGVRVGEGGAAQLSLSRNGTLVYVPGGAMSVSELVWVDREGKVEPLGFPPLPFGTFQLSPEGRRLAVVVNERHPEVWIYDLERGTRDKLTLEGDNANPIWTPDGKRVVFSSNRGGRTSLYSKAVDGSGDTEVLLPSDKLPLPYSWTPDGRMLAISTLSSPSGAGLWVHAIDGEREMRPFRDTPANEWGPDISPDGRWVAYTSDMSGRYEVYVQAFPSGGRTWTISTEGGEEPIWSPGGNELFYRNGDKWMAVPVSLGAQFSAGKPRELFRGLFPNVWERSYDVGPGARRFLLLRSMAAEGQPQQPQLVLNWFEELKEKMAEAEQ